jgi:tRNA pseudouridine55 synthase
VKPSFLVVDKPPGITSHDVVALVRAVTGVKKVGHTGTLDPFATGVLPLALGGATRLIQYLDERIKVYDAVVAFGSATDTGDPTGEVVRTAPLPVADTAEVNELLRSMVGPQLQRPPAYSAVKVKGKRLYQYARKGETVEVEPRKIELFDLELLEYDREHLRVRIECSRGTYARVLADDIATALKSAGHLSALQRPRSGPFLLEDAIGMDELGRLVAGDIGKPWQDVLLKRRREERVPWRPREEVAAGLASYLRSPLEALSHLPLADVRPSDARRIRDGGPPPPAPPAARGSRFAVVCGDEMIAVAEDTPRGPVVLRVVPGA